MSGIESLFLFLSFFLALSLNSSPIPAYRRDEKESDVIPRCYQVAALPPRGRDDDEDDDGGGGGGSGSVVST